MYVTVYVCVCINRFIVEQLSIKLIIVCYYYNSTIIIIYYIGLLNIGYYLFKYNMRQLIYITTKWHFHSIYWDPYTTIYNDVYNIKKKHGYQIPQEDMHVYTYILQLW